MTSLNQMAEVLGGNGVGGQVRAPALGHSANDRSLSSAAPSFQPENGPETKAIAIAATPFSWLDPADIPPRQFLYGGHLIRQFVSTTVAPGGIGKSSLGILEALAMASGKPL